MPYIKPPARSRLGHNQVYLPETPGELNYAITKLCLDFIVEKNYDSYNEVIGVLECAKLEFYRRAVGPYEDEKIVENGDVY